MTLRQRICAFIGHDSKAYLGYGNHGVIIAVSLSCQKCGYKTKWFSIENYDKRIKSNG